MEFHIPNQGRSQSILATHYFVVIFELPGILRGDDVYVGLFMSHITKSVCVDLEKGGGFLYLGAKKNSTSVSS